MGYTTYLKIEGVDGDCTEEGLKGWMAIDSFNHSITGPQANRNGAFVNDVCISRFADRSTPLLALATAEGRHYRSAVIRLVQTDGAKERLMELRLANVQVTSHSLAGGSPGDLKTPYENLSLHFDKVEWVYYPTPSTPVRTGWSTEAAAALS